MIDIQNLSKSLKGKKRSKEQKRKMSKITKNLWTNPIWRRKVIKANSKPRGKPRSEETKQILREAARCRWEINRNLVVKNQSNEYNASALERFQTHNPLLPPQQAAGYKYCHRQTR